MHRLAMLKRILRLCVRPWRILCLFKMWCKSVKASYCLTGRMIPLKVRVLDAEMRVVVQKAEDARVRLAGMLTIGGWLGQAEPVYISIGRDAILDIGGDFHIGAGSRISVADKAKLVIGGRKNESASGTTERTIILCQKSIMIGEDFLGAWNLFITDADHHQYGKFNPPRDVKIGNHVWICPNATILKGVDIGDNSVVTNGAVVREGVLPERSLIGGNPAKRICEAKEWHR
jgi:hypothetical protein